MFSEPVPTLSATVDLPTFNVTETKILPAPESWRYAQIKGFEILANGSDREAFRLVHDFQRFHQALIAAWPVAENPSSVPTSLILCGSGNKFAAFKPQKEVAPDGGLVSLSYHDQEISAIIIDLESKSLDLSALDSMSAPAASEDDGAGGGGPPTFIVDQYRQLYREYIHFVLSMIEPRSPAWLEEGLSQIFMRMQFSANGIMIGKLEDAKEHSVGNATGDVVEDRDFNISLQHHGLLKLPDLFGVAHDSPEALNPIASVWAKECYAFVHYCIYAKNGALQKPFFTFLERLSHAPITEAMFRDCFKVNYASMLEDLNAYIGFTVYKATFLKVKPGTRKISDPPNFQFRAATQSEIGRIKGEALRIAGNREVAHETMIAPYVRGERDPALLAALGLEEHALGDDTRARKFLEAAAAAKVGRPRAYLELARFRYAEAIAQPTGKKGKFGGVQVVGILRPLFSARGQLPALPEVYETIVMTWARSEAAPTRENLQVVTEGVRLFPRRETLVYQAAQLMAQFGFYADARAFTELGMKVAPGDGGKERFLALKESLPRETAAPVSAGTTSP